MRILLIMNGSRERYAGGADEARLRRWSEYCSPGTQLELGYLPSEAENFAFGSGEAIAFAALYPSRCVQAEQEGYDAAIMHCCLDPGLREARALVRMPVIGPGEVTFRTGAMLGRKLGVTVPSGGSIDHTWQQLRDAGVNDLVVGIEPIERPIGAYAQQDPRAMADSYVEAARRLVQRGADVICPSGLAFIPVRVAACEVSQRLGVTVLDPALLATRTAELLVQSRCQGG